MDVKDPVCGMKVDPERAVSMQVSGEPVFFCSDFCMREYERTVVGTDAPRLSEARPSRHVAYFSMEIFLEPDLPTYAGGLGVLAGDMLRSCADLRVPVVGVTLLHRKGYFVQSLGSDGSQHEQPAQWRPEQVLEPLPGLVEVEIEGRRVQLRTWQRELVGSRGYVVPVLLLDSDVEGNAQEDRRLTDWLYGGDERYRLAQEIILGIGGLRALRKHGYEGVRLFHLNEGHAALATLELLRLERNHGGWGFGAVQRRCVFTTHTPVPAGHDQFDWNLLRQFLGEPVPSDVMVMVGGQERLNMTLLALNLSHFINGVARKHEEVSEKMFPGRNIRHITNGVHSVTWTSPEFRELFDHHIPEWREDPAMLRHAANIPDGDLWTAHLHAKERLLAEVHRRTGQVLSAEALTLGFGRRATGYKRMTLILSDLERLRRISQGKLQLVFAGKAHPRDETGRQAIQAVHHAAAELGSDVKVVFIPDYDAALAALMVAGVDVWLNTPKPPLEASGTSGMKAAHNGVPSLSTLDGWWIEGCIEGVTGWGVGSPAGEEQGERMEVQELLSKLEHIADLYHRRRSEFMRVMRNAISLNASFFNSHRMVQQYVTNAYLA